MRKGSSGSVVNVLSGSKLTATLLSEMDKRDSKYGMVSMCIGLGMGAAGIFEKLKLWIHTKDQYDEQKTF